jgi:hypothetical protein
VQTLSLQQADIIRVLQSPQTRRVILVINLLLIVWIASILASLTWDLLSPDAAIEPVEAVADAAPVQVNLDRQLISQMPGWHLMGVARQSSAPVQASTPVTAPETKLKLILLPTRGARNCNTGWVTRCRVMPSSARYIQTG